MTALFSLLSILFGSLIASQLHAADRPPKVYATPQEAAADRAYELQGEYISESLAMQVVALGKDEFQVALYRGGLPDAKHDGKNRQLSTETSESLKGLIDDFGLKKTERRSPTLGQRPPDAAIVLFDGTRETFEKHWKSDARMTDDGLLQEGATSLDQFRDFSLHIEFRLPFMPEARGQARGNSGIYYQGRYETQMLDSFGLEGKNNETGGIYEIRDPDLNMCFPPLTWQTYDAEFTAARWDKAGNKTADARLTVRLNGVVVQPDVPLPHITRAAPVPESPEPGPIYLQNHGNPVRYRNIWVVPRDADQESRRPVVPGFERFYGDFASDHLAGGRLLVGELGCVHCHAASQEAQADLRTKRAPILDDVSRRIRPEWAYAFIAAPHHVKPGTTMPGLFEGWSDEDRDAAVKAVVSFLFAPGGLTEQLSDQASADRGQALFHEVGCAVCHAPRDGQVVRSATTVPLPDMAAR